MNFGCWIRRLLRRSRPARRVVGQLDPARSTQIYRFASAADGKFFFDAQQGSNITWRLYNPQGHKVFDQSFTDVDVLTLAVPGTYTLLVEGYYYASGVQDYQFNVQPVPAVDSQPLTVGSSATGAIGVVGEEHRYTFSLAANSTLYFDVLSYGTAANWTLVGPSGTMIDQLSFYSSDSLNTSDPLLRLPAGDYEITIGGNGETVGDYEFRLLDTAAATPITPGTPVVGQLDPARSTQIYRFASAADGKFFFDAQQGSYIYLAIVQPAGA